MYQPVSTYRIQFHKDFTFSDLRKILPYLSQLGIRTIYASPIFEAEKGSTHGYDQINPLRINPEIGTLEELEAIHEELAAMNIGWLQDIVPNHMAYSTANTWLMDVLEYGKASPYTGFFDVLFAADEPLMAPFLGDTLARVLARKEIKLVRKDGQWRLSYFDACYPVKAESLAGYDAATLSQAHEQPELMRTLLAQQHYRLCHWQETNRHINYRRFFTVNGLICLNAQEEFVFETTHALALDLLKRGVFNGLRIDHIDGLLNPAQYLNRLREKAGSDAYIVVEKILETGEALPVSWPVQGTTGYGFLAQVNNLLTWSAGKAGFSGLYERITGQSIDIERQLAEKKKWILDKSMQGELHNLTHQFLKLSPDFSFEPLKNAIAALLQVLPQYRFYGNEMPLRQQEIEDLSEVFERAGSADPASKNILSEIEQLLLHQPFEGNAAYNRQALYAYQRLMQLSGPLMAKGMEDTLMYTCNRFLGHNEVGDSPENFGMSVSEFHSAMLDRRRHWPLALNALATHDTKRGADARALLQVLTAIPDAWEKKVAEWQVLNAPLKTQNAPDDNEIYFLYQTLFATWPLHPDEESGYQDRLLAYLQKAQREAKVYTDWDQPDLSYETAVKEWVQKLLDPEHPFLKSLLEFRQKYQDFGLLNALSQVVLQTTAPGVPDVYQGAELWDQSFVDPDNRRPVAYSLRKQLLQTQPGVAWEKYWDTRLDGVVKLKLLNQLLQLRSTHPTLFSEGSYLPLTTSGAHAGHILAFARKHKRQWLLVTVGLHLPQITDERQNTDWADTGIQLPPGLAEAWKKQHPENKLSGNSLSAAVLFAQLPLYFELFVEEEKPRGAGILAALSSLSTNFGLGDLGPEAHRFAKLLGQQGWRYWQLLPLTPVSAGTGYSPYSSTSTLAINPLFISPEFLAEVGLLAQKDLRKEQIPVAGSINYSLAEEKRNQLLKKAFEQYSIGDFLLLKSKVAAFCEAENWWLEDYALYCTLKADFNDLPWYEWPEAFRQRDHSALRRFAEEKSQQLAFYKWQQAMAAFQCRNLRLTCQQNGVSLIGDLPFYASYDSADVWSQQHLFSLDRSGKMTGMAGVPPDYFSEYGQLWGMPTFRWDEMRKDNFQWWINRLKKNLEYCDLLRIDHFRALAAYWEVPAGAQTAIDGTWQVGPGLAFFEAVEQALGHLPFIAEDLGDQMEAVYQLRDKVGLPGMTVLQFAFGDDLPVSVHAPHNYKPNTVCYTGTHDNNTMLGWFRKDAGIEDKKRLEAYAGKRISENNLPEITARLVLSSVARIAILPLQDVLKLDETARMNLPGTGAGNWTWRLRKPVTEKQLSWLQEFLDCYGRL